MTRCFQGVEERPDGEMVGFTNTHTLGFPRDGAALQGNRLGRGARAEKEHGFLFPGSSSEEQTHPEERFTSRPVQIRSRHSKSSHQLLHTHTHTD